MSAEAERCPECGVALDRPWDAERPRLNHEAGSKACKVRKWEREAAERDLVRVEGETAIEIERFGVPIAYGPVFDSPKTDNFKTLGAFAAQSRTLFVTGAFAPRWASYLILLGTRGSFGWGGKLQRAFDLARVDERFALAVASTGMLIEHPGERKTALAALVKDHFESIDTIVDSAAGSRARVRNWGSR